MSTREKIFMAAKLCFMELGFDATTMDKVAARAGVTKMTVYAHAESKDRLFAFVVTGSIELSREKIWAIDLAGDPTSEIANFLARINEIACWHVSIGLQRTIIANATRFPDHARSVHEGVFSAAETKLGIALTHWRYVVNAASLIEEATGHRRHLTLYGLQEPLPLPASQERVLQDGAMDVAIRSAVKRLHFK